MTQELLISYKDFPQFKNISPNTSTAKDLEPYILEAQRVDIEPFLGSALYHDIITTYPYANVTEAEAIAARDTAILAGEEPPVNYSPLIQGETYLDCNGESVFFYGLKMMIVYYAYARFIHNLANRVTRHGVVKQNSSYSDRLSNAEVKELMNEARSIALKYRDDTHKYLCEKKEDYPLYKGYYKRDASNRSIKIRSSNGSVKYKDSGDYERYRFNRN